MGPFKPKPSRPRNRPSFSQPRAYRPLPQAGGSEAFRPPAPRPPPLPKGNV